MKRIFLYTVAIASLAFTSCNDLLNLEPLDKISQADYFKSENDLQLFTNPFYNNLLNKSPYDEQSDVYVCQTLSNEMLGGNKRIVPASGGGWSWSDLRRMNTLLAYADQCTDASAALHYKALTRFFRAFFYFEKVKRFGDVPWYEEELGSNSPSLYNPRDSRELVMTKMIEDIDYAITNLPDEKAEKSAPYRVTRWAALALKTQFCLYEGTYRKYHNLSLEGHDYAYYLDLSAKAARELMDQGPYKLFDTNHPESDYLNLFSAENANKDEYILAIKFSYDLKIFHNATAHALMSTQGRPGLPRKMVNTYLMKDGTAFTDRIGWQTMTFLEEIKDRDPRLYQTIRTPGYKRIGTSMELAPDLACSVTGYQPIKYVQDPKAAGGQVDRAGFSTCDLPVYRFAEVLLNYAEAKAELGTLTQADLDASINLIRDRAGMPDLKMSAANAAPDRYLSAAETGYPNVTGSNKGVILEIRRERAIELTEEGFRFNDLVRWTAGKCIDQAITGMYFPGPGSYDLTADGKPDVVLYEQGTTKPAVQGTPQIYELGKDIVLTQGTKGYINFYSNIVRTPFNEGRDYLYPIPTDERSLNHNLTQNPGWADGLDF